MKKKTKNLQAIWSNIFITHVTQDFFYLLLKPIVTYLSYVLRFNFEGLIFNAPCTIKHSKLRIG
ncbi:MAG: Unknown protein [uncultured Aureispira sp.]|uniref:Uncharacterized protein n=1 Tax=uncultured Aureispira sp. TaxID=1331704 RepID=A0A6S6U130_9BACT|nr:MAG: Unknown protein [uncultured Aureispira sp.]